MGNRFILTEEEKLRIKSLYENANPPEDFEVVGYVNPFRDTKYLPYAKIEYSKELKDGDLFYNLPIIGYRKYSTDKYENCLTDFIEPIKSNFSDLIGKTVRTESDSIKKIGEIDIRLGQLIRGMMPTPRTELLLYLIKTPEDVIPYVIYVIDEKGSLIEKENLIQTIQNRLPKIKAKELPDCLFELKRVKRVKTDFIP